MDVLLVDWIWHIWHCDSWRMTIWKDYLNEFLHGPVPVLDGRQLYERFTRIKFSWDVFVFRFATQKYTPRIPTARLTLKKKTWFFNFPFWVPGKLFAGPTSCPEPRWYFRKMSSVVPSFFLPGSRKIFWFTRKKHREDDISVVQMG